MAGRNLINNSADGASDHSDRSSGGARSQRKRCLPTTDVIFTGLFGHVGNCSLCRNWRAVNGLTIGTQYRDILVWRLLSHQILWPCEWAKTFGFPGLGVLHSLVNDGLCWLATPQKVVFLILG